MTAGATREDEAVDGVPEQMLGPYRLLDQLGEGGMGVVHLALAPSGRAVAIKVLRPHIAHDSDARARLAREVSTLSRVQDPGVAAVLDADTEGDRPYIVTRYVPGPPLDRVVADHGPLQGEALVRVGRGLSRALGAIHAAGVIHRDLKPANVLLLHGDPVVIDFGIAHVADDVRLTMTGLVMGTPGYLSPEVLEGAPVTEATDWWGWAATLAFAASGTPPFGRGHMEAVLDRVRGGRADLSGVDPRLQPLLQAALSPDASRRPGAEEVVEALERYAGGGEATVSLPLRDPTSVVSASATRPMEPVPAPSAQAPSAQAPSAQAQQQPAQQRPDWGPLSLPADEDEGWGGVPGEGVPDESWPGEGWRGEAETDWEAARELGPGEPDPRIGRPSRAGTLVAMLAAVVAVAAVWPVVGLAVLVAWSLLARFADRSVTSLVMRRHAAGRRRSDVPVAVISSPWHVLTAAVATVVSLLLPLVVAVATAFSAALALTSVTGGSPQPDRAPAVAAGALVGVLVAWWGASSPALRRGSRSLVRGVARTSPATRALVVVLVLAAAALAAAAWSRHGLVSWWPWSGTELPLPSFLSR
jgi:serine/threonine protein kinase